jgi:antibiotic biosynthesis monooxygenase (ABM) superfamily enzyme
MSIAVATDENATVVITHNVRPTHENDYENWLREIVPVASAQPGHLGAMVIRPVPGASSTYTVVIRFDTQEHLVAWMSSEERARLIKKVQPCIVEEDRYQVQSGLDFWFTPEGVKPRIPKKWKQSLVTWSAIFPLVLSITFLVKALEQALGIPANYYLNMLAITGIVVLLMVYIVMPRYTKLIHRWLYN